jgi:hypothetical protein
MEDGPMSVTIRFPRETTSEERRLAIATMRSFQEFQDPAPESDDTDAEREFTVIFPTEMQAQDCMLHLATNPMVAGGLYAFDHRIVMQIQFEGDRCWRNMCCGSLYPTI